MKKLKKTTEHQKALANLKRRVKRLEKQGYKFNIDWTKTARKRTKTLNKMKGEELKKYAESKTVSHIGVVFNPEHVKIEKYADKIEYTATEYKDLQKKIEAYNKEGKKHFADPIKLEHVSPLRRNGKLVANPKQAVINYVDTLYNKRKEYFANKDEQFMANFISSISNLPDNDFAVIMARVAEKGWVWCKDRLLQAMKRNREEAGKIEKLKAQYAKAGIDVSTPEKMKKNAPELYARTLKYSDFKNFTVQLFSSEQMEVQACLSDIWDILGIDDKYAEKVLENEGNYYSDRRPKLAYVTNWETYKHPTNYPGGFKTWEYPKGGEKDKAFNSWFKRSSFKGDYNGKSTRVVKRVVVDND